MKKLDVNLIKLYRFAFDKIAQSKKLSFRDVALYYALIGYWNKYWFPEVLSINREDLLNYSKIGSPNTYLRAMRALDKHNIIKYMPSKNAAIGSKVKFCIDRSVLNQNLTYGNHKNDTELSSLINNSKHDGTIQIPEKKEVIEFFIENSSNNKLAEKFYNHNSALGWLSNGQNIVNWKSFALNYLNKAAQPKNISERRKINDASAKFDSGDFNTSTS
jgi:hypothetical protein